MTAPVSLRLRTLFVKKGVSLGLLGHDDRRLVLAVAASQFEPGRAYPEQAVNALLIEWLSGGGAMLRTDHAELRRWLVDACFLERDGFGRAYVRIEAALLPFAADLGGVSGAALNELASQEKAAWVANRKAKRHRHDAGVARGDSPLSDGDADRRPESRP
ncbi:MAG: DUF2087 domain-containing protein [Caldimonas sp.]